MFLIEIADMDLLAQPDFAAIGSQFFLQNAEESRFAGAIGTNDADFITSMDFKIHILKKAGDRQRIF